MSERVFGLFCLLSTIFGAGIAGHSFHTSIEGYIQGVAIISFTAPFVGCIIWLRGSKA